MKACLKLLFLIFSYVLAKPPSGYHLLPGVHFRKNFTDCIVEVTEKIRDFQELRDKNQIFYVLPIYIDIDYPKRAIYLALNVRCTDEGNGDAYKEYLYLREIYDRFDLDRNIRPVSLIPSQLDVAYPDNLPQFNPSYFTHDYILNSLNRDPRETVVKLALVFVESIRFSPIRDAVQNSLINGNIINFNIFRDMIKSWEKESKRVADSFRAGSLDILFNISVFHIRQILEGCFLDLLRLNWKENMNRKEKRSLPNPHSSYPNVIINVKLFNHYAKDTSIRTEYECWLECYNSHKCVASMYSNDRRECYLYSYSLKYLIIKGYAAYMKQNFKIEDFQHHISSSCCGFFDFRCCCTKGDGTKIVNNVKPCVYFMGCNKYGWQC